MAESKTASKSMEKIVSLCKRRGYVFQSSGIYGGINGCWDFGPLGVELKRNLKDHWWYTFVQQRDDIVGKASFHGAHQFWSSLSGVRLILRYPDRRCGD